MTCDPLRQSYKTHIAKTVLNSFSVFSDDKWFLSIARSSPWPIDLQETGSVEQEGSVPVTSDSDKDTLDFWTEAIAHKRILPSDVSLVVPKYSWQYKKVYTPYRNTVDLFSETEYVEFYVLVEEERVYKCIDNNYGAESTVIPIHTDSEIRELSDGYKWKFMYQIPESKRKFITETVFDGAKNIVKVGYMPIEDIDFLLQNDDRTLQYFVKKSAINGSIDFIEFDEDYRNSVVTTGCLFPNTINDIVFNCAAGATTVTVASPSLNQLNGSYNNYILNIDAGKGEGQRRTITSYTYGLTSEKGTVVVDYPLVVGLSAGTSKYSILPNIKITGDGSSVGNTLNPQINRADVGIVVGAKTNSVNTKYQNYISGFSMVDTGKNYSNAVFSVVAGITGITGGVDLTKIAHIILPPAGGHGYNPVQELGAASLMILSQLDTQYGDIVTTRNDYRQIAIIKNPLLTEKQVRLRLYETGYTGSFAVGLTAFQGATSVSGQPRDMVRGTVLSWRPGTGLSGGSGSAELVIGNISTTGNFKQGGRVKQGANSFSIYSVDEKTLAGTEGRNLLQLRLGSVNSAFSAEGTDFKPGLMCVTLGNKDLNIKSTNSTGEIYRWSPNLGTKTSGNLYLESVRGIPAINEKVAETSLEMKMDGWMSEEIGKIIDTTEKYEGTKTYPQDLAINVEASPSYTFTKNSFTKDSTVYGMDSYGSIIASGKVLDWDGINASVRATLHLTNISGLFENAKGITYMAESGLTTGGLSGISHLPSFVSGSGELVYIQNMNAITRNPEQKEEIKIIFNL